MKIEMLSPSELIPYKNNPRKNEQAINKVATSISEFGFKQRINCFFIAGLETQEEWENFKYIIGQDYDSMPKIGIIVNYIDYSKGTPLQNHNPFDIIPIDIAKIKYVWKLWNGRIVIFHDQSIRPYNSIFDSIMQQCSTEDVERLLKIKRKTIFHSIEEMENKLKYNISTEYSISNIYDKALKKMSEHINA